MHNYQAGTSRRSSPCPRVSGPLRQRRDLLLATSSSARRRAGPRAPLRSTPRNAYFMGTLTSPLARDLGGGNVASSGHCPTISSSREPVSLALYRWRAVVARRAAFFVAFFLATDAAATCGAGCPGPTAPIAWPALLSPGGTNGNDVLPLSHDTTGALLRAFPHGAANEWPASHLHTSGGDVCTPLQHRRRPLGARLHRRFGTDRPAGTLDHRRATSSPAVATADAAGNVGVRRRATPWTSVAARRRAALSDILYVRSATGGGLRLRPPAAAAVSDRRASIGLPAAARSGTATARSPATTGHRSPSAATTVCSRDALGDDHRPLRFSVRCPFHHAQPSTASSLRTGTDWKYHESCLLPSPGTGEGPGSS